MSSFSAQENLKRSQALCFLVCSSMCKEHFLQCTVIRGIRDLLKEITVCALPPGRRVVAKYNVSHDAGLCDFFTQREAHTAPPRHSNIVIYTNL